MLPVFSSLRELTFASVAVRMCLAVLCGGIIGLERTFRRRPAGFRTHMLICLGASMTTLISQFLLLHMHFYTDMARIGAQVVAGIGFIGAGTIIVTRRSQIKGLTTAAGLWSAAGVGLALGIGFYEAAIVGTVAIFSVMTLLQRWDNRMHRKTKTVEVYIEISRELSLGDLLRELRERDMEVQDVQRESGLETDGSGNRAYMATLKTKVRRIHAEIVEDVRMLPHVVYVEEL